MIPIFFELSLILILIFLFYKYKENFAIAFVIITLLAIPPEILPDLRLIIHLVDTILLGYLFFKEYGFETKKFPTIPKSVRYWLIFLFGSFLISMVFSKYPSAGIKLILRSIAFFIIVYFFYGIIKTQKHVNVIIYSLLISGILVTGSVIIDFIMQGHSISDLTIQVRDTNFGSYDNKNITGAYSIITLPLFLILLFNNPNRRQKIFAWFGIAVISLSGILLASRAAIAGIIIGTTAILFFNNKRIFKIFSTLTAVIVIGYFLLPDNLSLDYALRIEEGLSGHDKFWEMAYNMIQKNPIFGIGPGAYPAVEFNYIPVMMSSYLGQKMIEYNYLSIESGSNNSHNFYLLMTSDMGILGLIIAISIIFIFFRLSFITYEKYKFNKDVLLILSAIISVGICLLLRSFVESNGIFYYGVIASDLPFWLLFIILVSYYKDKVKLSECKTY